MAAKKTKKKSTARKSKSQESNNGDLISLFSPPQSKTSNSKRKPSQKKDIEVKESRSIGLKFVNILMDNKNFKQIYTTADFKDPKSINSSKIHRSIFNHKFLNQFATKEYDVFLDVVWATGDYGYNVSLSLILNFEKIGDKSANMLLSKDFCEAITPQDMVSDPEVIRNKISLLMAKGSIIEKRIKELSSIKTIEESEVMKILKSMVEVRLSKEFLFAGTYALVDETDISQMLTRFPGVELNRGLYSLLQNTFLNISSEDNFLSFEYEREKVDPSTGEIVRDTGSIVKKVSSAIRSKNLMQGLAEVCDKVYVEYVVVGRDVLKGLKIF